MNKKMLVLVALLILAVVVSFTAEAANPRPVTEDTYWDKLADAAAVNGGSFNVFAEGSESACNLSKVGLLKWDVSDISDSTTVGSVTIRLENLKSITGTDDTSVISLYEAPDLWDESTSQGQLPNPPDHNNTTATVLATATGPFTLGGNVVFQGSGSSDPLVQYVQDQITGDNLVSFWVEITDGCPGGGTGRIVWSSREDGTAYMELSTPTAIAISDFSANGSVNWSLIAGLVALAAVVILGVGYGVRRYTS